METFERNRGQYAKKGAGLLLSGAATAATKSPGVGGAVLAATAGVPLATMAFADEFRASSKHAMAKDGVDFTDKRAAATWVRDNPELSQKLTMQALQSAGLEYASGKVGEQAGGVVSNPLGKFATEQGVSEGMKKVIDIFGQ